MIPQPKIKYIGAHKVNGRGLWVLLQDFQWQGHKVPKGFITDGGSIIDLFAGYIKPTGLGFPCFIIHDYMYSTHDRKRILADLQMKRLMKLRGINIFQCDLAFIGVRIGGHKSWNCPDPTFDDCV